MSEHVCSYCTKTFTNPNQKFRHMVKTHAKKYQKDLTKDGWKTQKKKFGRDVKRK